MKRNQVKVLKPEEIVDNINNSPHKKLSNINNSFSLTKLAIDDVRNADRFFEFIARGG